MMTAIQESHNELDREKVTEFLHRTTKPGNPVSEASKAFIRENRARFEVQPTATPQVDLLVPQVSTPPPLERIDPRQVAPQVINELLAKQPPLGDVARELPGAIAGEVFDTSGFEEQAVGFGQANVMLHDLIGKAGRLGESGSARLSPLFGLPAEEESAFETGFRKVREFGEEGAIAVAPEDTGREGFLISLNRAAGAAPTTIATFAGASALTGSPVAGFAAVEALQASDKGAKASTIAATHGMLMGLTLGAFGTLASTEAAVGTGATFALDTALQGGSTEDIAASFFVGAGLSSVAAKKDGPSFRKALKAAKQIKVGVEQQAAIDAVMMHISVAEKKGFRPPTLNELYADTVDNLNPISRVVKTLHKISGTGERLATMDDAYKLARLQRGWHNKAEHFLRQETFSFKTNQGVGKSLQELLKPVENNLDQFRTYIVSKRVIELDRRGIKQPVDAKAARAAVKATETPEFIQAFADLKTYQDSLLQYLVDSGVLTSKQKAAMKQLNDDFVPLYKLAQTDSAGTGQGKKLANLFDPIKRIKGSDKPIIDPIESIVKNTYAFINLAERHAVGDALVRQAEKIPGQTLVRKIKPPVKPISVTKAEVKSFLGENAEAIRDVNWNQLPDVLQTFRQNATVSKGDPIIWVLRDGKRKYFEVDPDVHKALLGLDEQSVGMLVRLMSVPARALRAGVTITPEFAARNPLRDQWTAYIQSEYGYVPPIDFIKGVFHMVGRTDMLRKFERSGAGRSMMVSMDRAYLQKSLDQVLAEHNAGSLSKSILKHPVEAVRILSELGETGTRLGVYSRAMRKMQKSGITGKEAEISAGFEARRVTIDFGVHGAKTQAMSQLTAFFNPNIQGTNEFVKTLRDNPKRTSARVAASITLPSVLLWMANHDDARYKEIPGWQKDIFWIIMPDHISDEQWADMTSEEKAQGLSEDPLKSGIWRIPKPFGPGQVFGSLPERILDRIFLDDPDTIKEFSKTFFETNMPGFIPTAALPIIENFANKSLFLDRPIVPLSKQRLDPREQFGAYTSEFAKIIGDATNRSPAKLENLIRGWTGGTGLYGLDAIDAVMQQTGITDLPPAPKRAASDTPLLRAFAVRHPSSSAESIREFYDLYKKSETAMATFRSKMKPAVKMMQKKTALQAIGQELLPQEEADLQRNLQQVEKFIRKGDNEFLINHSPALSLTANQINGYQELIRDTRKNRRSSPGDKRIAIDAAYFDMIDWARGIVDTIEADKRASQLTPTEKELKVIRSLPGI